MSFGIERNSSRAQSRLTSRRRLIGTASAAAGIGAG